MTLLVTGHDGFVGRHLLACMPGTGLAGPQGERVDLGDRDAVFAAIERIRPTRVVHLAAKTFVPEAMRDPLGVYTVNFIGTQHLLDALRAIAFTGRVLYVSTADLYGSVEEHELPIRETQPTRPLNPYAVSKIAAEALCDYFVRAHGMDIVIARPFNHIGPGQSARFALADFARSIAAMRAGRREPVLSVGDLDVTRDFSDVRDVVAAYRLLLERGLRGETYNVCSGTERHLGGTVRRLAELAGVDLRIEVDPARLRGASQRRSVGKPDKLIEATGWIAAHSFDQTLRDILDSWTFTDHQ